MGCAFAVWNSTGKDQWYVLRSSDGRGMLLKIPIGTSSFIRMADGEIVTSFVFSSQKEAEDSIGKGEKDVFTTVEAKD